MVLNQNLDPWLGKWSQKVAGVPVQLTLLTILKTKIVFFFLNLKIFLLHYKNVELET